MKKITAGRGIKDFNISSTSLLFLLLLSADMAFFTIHSIKSFTRFIPDNRFSIETDQGFAETYQYIKWFWISIEFALLSISRRSLSYVSWIFIFIYLLCDDALSLHENIGTLIANRLTFSPPLGLRLQDFGELAVTIIAGLILLSSVWISYCRGSYAFQKISQDILLLLLALSFCGVFVDMAHIAIHLGGKVNIILGFIEDGGEMLVASMIVGYVFSLSIRKENASPYLCDLLRSTLAKRFV
jgi:hypothetical protein